MTKNSGNRINYDDHWAWSQDTYKNHPTSRHRRRFVLNEIRKNGITKKSLIFDYGCGPGLLLQDIRERFGLSSDQLCGCDISSEAVEAARSRFPQGYFYNCSLPAIDGSMDLIVCTEVIEHTSKYKDILIWIASNLTPGGLAVITTPGGTMDPPDEYYGHIQHFRLEELREILESLGFCIVTCRYWGFPLFTLQKWVTKRYFVKVRDKYMHGNLTIGKMLIFDLATFLYYIHDLIPRGPQILISATKR